MGGCPTESCHVIALCRNVAVSLCFYLMTYAIHFINNYMCQKYVLLVNGDRYGPTSDQSRIVSKYEFRSIYQGTSF